MVDLPSVGAGAIVSALRTSKNVEVGEEGRRTGGIRQSGNTTGLKKHHTGEPRFIDLTDDRNLENWNCEDTQKSI